MHPPLQSIKIINFSRINIPLLLILFLSLFFTYSTHAIADDFDDEDEVIIAYLKKIRDNNKNYLPNVMKATARAISKGGEFKIKKYKRKKYKNGPIIEVNSLKFNFSPYKEGMSNSEIANAGLETLASIGDLFGYGDKAKKLRTTNEKLQDPDGILEKFSDDEQILITMNATVKIYDNDDIEISRNVKYEKVFNNKSDFKKKQNQIIEAQLIKSIKIGLIEYLEELDE